MLLGSDVWAVSSCVAANTRDSVLAYLNADTAPVDASPKGLGDGVAVICQPLPGAPAPKPQIRLDNEDDLYS